MTPRGLWAAGRQHRQQELTASDNPSGCRPVVIARPIHSRLASEALVGRVRLRGILAMAPSHHYMTRLHHPAVLGLYSAD
jgi:hypothetical protein